MNRAASLLLLAAALACADMPTGGGEPEPIPTGTILVDTPNGQEAGTYLVDVETGAVTQIADHGNPLSVAFEGRYSARSGFVYGRRTQPFPRNIMKFSVLHGDTTALLAGIDPDLLVGAYDLSPNEDRLAIQIQYWPTGEIHLYTVDLASSTWNPIIDAAAGIDSIPLAELRWSPDGETLYTLTDVYPDRSELVRIDLATQQFQIISPTTPVLASLDVSPDGRVLAHQDGDGRINFRDRYGTLLDGFPEVEPRVIRPRFSPDGKFLAYQEIIEGVGEGPIILMRLSDGKRWPLKINVSFTVWLADWF